MATNSQQFGFRQDSLSRRMNKVNVLNFERQISYLSSLVQRMAWGSMQQVKAYGICAAPIRPNDMCPTLHEEANPVEGFPNPPQKILILS